MPDIKIKGYSGVELPFADVPKVWLAAPESTEENPVLLPYTYGEALDGVEVEPDFSGGDMQVTVPEGYLLRSGVVKKPENLIPGNIKKGETIAGIPGEYEGETVELEEVTVDLAMADGDQVIEPTEGKALGKVTLTKPETLVPENIAEGVDIGGVIGALVGGGDEKYGQYWIDDICFWDLDGSLILNVPLSEIVNLSELPMPPAHDGLVFQGWNYTLEELQNATYPRDVGAVYETIDGNTHAVLKVNSSGNLAVPVCFQQTVSEGVSISWGDGTTSKVSGTGAVNTAHTYPSTGTYEVVFAVQDGCQLTLGGNTSSTTFIGGSNSTYKGYLNALHIGNGVQLSTHSIYQNNNMQVLTIPNGITSFPERCVQSLTGVKAIIIPRGVTSVGVYAFNGCYGNYRSEDKRTMSIPETLETLASSAFGGSSKLHRIIIPGRIKNVPVGVLTSHKQVKKIFMADTVTYIGDCASNEYLRYITIPKNLEEVGNSFLSGCKSMNQIVFPKSLKKIGSHCLQNVYLDKLVVQSNIEIGTYFNQCKPGEIIVTADTFSDGMASLLETDYYRSIYVPDELVSTYKSKTGLGYEINIYPLSKYVGNIPQ